MAETRCIVCNSLHNENEFSPCCSPACENEVYDRGYEAFLDEKETLNLTSYREALDYKENNPVHPLTNENCIGYGKMCMCGTCMETWVGAVKEKYGE